MQKIPGETRGRHILDLALFGSAALICWATYVRDLARGHSDTLTYSLLIAGIICTVMALACAAKWHSYEQRRKQHGSRKGD